MSIKNKLYNICPKRKQKVLHKNIDLVLDNKDSQILQSRNIAVKTMASKIEFERELKIDERQ